MSRFPGRSPRLLNRSLEVGTCLSVRAWVGCESLLRVHGEGSGEIGTSDKGYIVSQSGGVFELYMSAAASSANELTRAQWLLAS